MASVVAGLTVTESYTVNEDKSPAARVDNCVFHATAVPFPASPATGVLYEAGGSGTGSMLGVLTDDAWFRIRMGDGGVGGAAPSTMLDVDTSHIDIPTGTGVLAPYFDGGLHSVSWEFNLDTEVIRFWIDDNLIGTSDNPPVGGTGYTATVSPANWAGGATGSWLGGTGENVDLHVGPVAWAGGTTGASGLDLYRDQLSTWVAGNDYDATSSLSIPSLVGSSTGTFVFPDLYDAVSTENLPSLIASTLATFQETLGYQIRAKVSVSGHADVYSNVEEIRYLQLGSAFSASSSLPFPMLTGSTTGTFRQSVKVYIGAQWEPTLAWNWNGSAWEPERYNTPSGWV